jgi:hypothetical protein
LLIGAEKMEANEVNPEAFLGEVLEAVTDLQTMERDEGGIPFELVARIAIVDDEEVMERLSPALQGCSSDAFAIAKTITPLLLSQVAAGAVSFPANVLIFASAALLLAEQRTELP